QEEKKLFHSGRYAPVTRTTKRDETHCERKGKNQNARYKETTRTERDDHRPSPAGLSQGVVHPAAGTFVRIVGREATNHTPPLKAPNRRCKECSTVFSTTNLVF